MSNNVQDAIQITCHKNNQKNMIHSQEKRQSTETNSEIIKISESLDKAFIVILINFNEIKNEHI